MSPNSFSLKNNYPRALGFFLACITLSLTACVGQNNTPNEGAGIPVVSENSEREISESEIRVEKVLVQESTCSNGKMDSGEADVDCGGSCETKCEPFKLCASVADCMTSFSYGGKDYTDIRCDDKVASFDPNNPAVLGKKMCINEQLFWEAIQAATAQAAPVAPAAPGTDSGDSGDGVKYLAMREGTPSLRWDSIYSRAHCPDDATIYAGSNDTRGAVLVPNIDLAHQSFACVIKFSEPYPNVPICVITTTGFATPGEMTFKIHSVTKDFVEVKGQVNGGSGATLAFNYICL